MQVKDIMTPSVECIKPDSTLDEAVEKMRTLNVGSLPICDDDRLITDCCAKNLTFIVCICRVFWAYRFMEVHFFAQLSVV